MAEQTNNTTSNATPTGMIGGSSAARQEAERSRNDARNEAKSLEAQKAARAGKVYDIALKYIEAYNEESIASGTNVTFGNDEFTLASSLGITTDGNTSSGGNSSSSHPWKMSLILDGSSDPIVTFDAEGTDVFIRNTNTLFYTLGDATGRPQNIENAFPLNAPATNYIYAEATWDSSTAVTIANHKFKIAVYTSEAPLFETDIDTAPNPDVEYQSVASLLIGTIQLNSNNELTGTGITQFTKTRQFVDLLYANSLTVRGFAS